MSNPLKIRVQRLPEVLPEDLVRTMHEACGASENVRGFITIECLICPPVTEQLMAHFSAATRAIIPIEYGLGVSWDLIDRAADAAASHAATWHTADGTARRNVMEVPC